jgi:hypothetical protein
MIRYSKGSYVIVPNKETLAGLKPALQTVFMWVCSYSDDDGVCFPDRETLAKKAGVSIDTVDKTLAKLCDKKLLRKVPRDHDRRRTVRHHRTAAKAQSR